MTTIREQLETIPCSPQSRYMRQHRINGIEDYLFIRGDHMTAAMAASRLGVTRPRRQDPAMSYTWRDPARITPRPPRRTRSTRPARTP